MLLAVHSSVAVPSVALSAPTHACGTAVALLPGSESVAPSLGGVRLVLALAKQLVGVSRSPRVLVVTFAFVTTGQCGEPRLRNEVAPV